MGWRPLIVFLAVFTGAAPGLAQQITAARYDAPTTRYAHGVLGDAVEWGALVLTLAGGEETRLTLPETRVFEDVAPRLADLDGDGNPEVIVVESSVSRGARLGVYDAAGMRVATPHIGRPNRWLAPVGAADLDGDGTVEIAYVDRPHLAMRLRVWRYEDGGLGHVADLGGLTNHKIGWDFIAGGIRDCGNGPEIITADSDWRNVVATRFSAGKLTPRDIAPYSGPGSVQTELECGG